MIIYVCERDHWYLPYIHYIIYTCYKTFARKTWLSWKKNTFIEKKLRRVSKFCFLQISNNYILITIVKTAFYETEKVLKDLSLPKNAITSIEKSTRKCVSLHVLHPVTIWSQSRSNNKKIQKLNCLINNNSCCVLKSDMLSRIWFFLLRFHCYLLTIK